jgi:hypothetical protein
MATTSTHSTRSRSASALDDSRRLAPHTQPSTAPPYYLGRPARVWLALYRRRTSHA